MTLFGYGITTKAIAKRFRNCVIFDDKFTSQSVDEYGNHLLPSHLFDPDSSNLEIISPGIAPHHPLAISAKNLISEYDLFSNNRAYKIWISGTNGKTTTTQMVWHLLKSKGAEVGGNIGFPLASLDETAPIWVLETSSFTIHYSKKASPNLYLLLPITPDHISWHGSFEEYEAAKLRPFATMKEGEIIIAPRKYANIKTNAFFMGYESEDDLAKLFGIDLSMLKFSGVFALDACLALAVAKILYDEINYELINGFVIDGHRQEEIRDYKNRLWIDDSKATNIDACKAAINRFCKFEIHLILGGDDKGADMSELFEFLQNKVFGIYAIGSNANRLCALARQHSINNTLCNTLDIAVGEIHKTMSQDSIGLLAPAAASLDQFTSYKHRGEKFKELVFGLNSKG